MLVKLKSNPTSCPEESESHVSESFSRSPVRTGAVLLHVDVADIASYSIDPSANCTELPP